jgi:hypothetical protein
MFQARSNRDLRSCAAQSQSQRPAIRQSGFIRKAAVSCVVACLGMQPIWAGAETLDPTGRTLRPGDKSVEAVVRTDERYGADGLFQGPRGWGYWNYLSDPRPIQNPNLWPDMHSTYFIARFELPAGARMVMKQGFPHTRYFQFALYVSENNTFVSNGETITGPGIQPDPGAVNPYVAGNRRDSDNRDFTLTILAEDPPADPSQRVANTLYAGAAGGVLQGVLRLYVSDAGWDGAGWGPNDRAQTRSGFPRLSGQLADGTTLDHAAVVKTFARPFEGELTKPLTDKQWIGMVNSPKNDPTLDPATAPARPGGKWEKYWTFGYSVAGAFKTPEERAKIPWAAAIDGGGDPNTQYMLAHLNRKFGPVYVLKGRKPSFPDTYAGADGTPLAVMPAAQVQYFSIVSAEAAPSGRIVDGLMDMQIPVDANGDYTIVYSRREDRPSNATPENGVAWLEWSPLGEGLDDPQNRPDFGMLMIRMMLPATGWADSPANITEPGTAEAVMGAYYPRGEYMTKAAFEALGDLK